MSEPGASDFWQSQLAGLAPAFELPTDRPRLPAPSYFRERAELAIEPGLWSAMASTAQSQGIDRYALALGAYALLVFRYTGQDDLCIGAAAGAGDDARLVPLRIGVPADATVAQLLASVKASVAGAAAHPTPFATVTAAAGATPLFRTLFLAEGLPGVLWDGTRTPSADRLGSEAAACDMVLTLCASPQGAALRADYDPELFDASTVDRVLGQLATALAGMVADAAQVVAALPLVQATERERLVDDWNRTAAAYEREACVHELIERQAARTPQATALSGAGATLSYAQLDARANQFAQLLIDKGVGPGVPVGICIARSTDMVVAVLAVLKAGGAYIPMDPDYPAQRIAYMIEDSRVSVVLADRDVAAQSAHVIRVDAGLEEGQPTQAPTRRSGPADLAYVIYTSGSTGKPKGVMVEHRNVVNFFAGMDARLGTEPGVWLAVTSLSFDISVLELLWTLARGYHVVLQTNRPAPHGRREEMGFGLFYFASDEGDYAQARGREKYKLLLEGARFADERGFDAVWTPERHFHTFGGLYPSPSVAAGALAAMTQRIGIRAGSVVLPLHNPVRVAEEWSLVDNLSEGRVGISFASGWQPQDFAIAPEAYADRQERMFAGIETVRALWRGEERVMPGGDGKPVHVTTRPRPVQAELPVWVTAGGSPETFRRAGEIGAGILTHLLGQSIEQLEERIAVYRESWRKHGHAGQAGPIALMLHTFVSHDPAFVRATVHEPLKNYLKGALGLFAPVAAAQGLNVTNMTPEDTEALAEFAFDRYFETSGLFGTPASCADMVARLKQIGVDELACLIDFGIPADTVLANLPYLDELRAASAQAAHAQAPDTSVGHLIREHGVTHLQCTPSMARMLLADAPQAEALASLRRMLVGGEALSEALATELRTQVRNGSVSNMYGPTETTVWSTMHDVDTARGAVPIGRPIANTQVYVLDPALNPLPVGVPGELYIGGDGVTRGYLNRPELTAERFVADPFTGRRMYRTGDLVRYRSDGALDFLGRVDQQVKLRGYRIELGEIESHLLRDAAVAEAAVTALPDEAGEPRLVAYLVARAGQSIDAERLRTQLRGMLMDYMVPSAYVVLPAFPRTPNGKLDRNALSKARAAVPAAATVAPVAPATTNGGPATADSSAGTALPGVAAGAMQKDIAAIWCDVLKVRNVGPRDNFFDLGGHSLLAVHVLNRLRAITPKALQLTDVFRFPTVESMARHLAESPGGGEATAGGGDRPLNAGQQRAAQRRERMRGAGGSRAS